MVIVPGDLDDPRVRSLLAQHLAIARAATAPGSDHGEVKSMHTASACRRTGVGRAMLLHLIGAARDLGMSRLSLETGSWAYFQPARALYQSVGFVECPPFGEYVRDPNSVFMSLELRR
jgi:putative acetyltransferase